MWALNPSFKPGFRPSFNPGFKPDFRPSFNPDFNPDFKPGFDPGLKPGFRPGFRSGFRPGQRVHKDGVWFAAAANTCSQQEAPTSDQLMLLLSHGGRSALLCSALLCSALLCSVLPSLRIICFNVTTQSGRQWAPGTTLTSRPAHAASDPLSIHRCSLTLTLNHCNYSSGAELYWSWSYYWYQASPALYVFVVSPSQDAVRLGDKWMSDYKLILADCNHVWTGSLQFWLQNIRKTCDITVENCDDDITTIPLSRCSSSREYVLLQFLD